MPTRHFILILLMIAATPAQAFFCFNFGFGSGNRGGAEFSRRPPPPYWSPAYAQPYPGYPTNLPPGYFPPSLYIPPPITQPTASE